MGFLARLEGRKHCLMLDNFFGSIQFFKDLVAMGIYAIGFDFTYFFSICNLFCIFCTPLIWLHFWQSFFDIIFTSIVGGL